MTIDGHLSPVSPPTHPASPTVRPPESNRPAVTEMPTGVGPIGVTPELWNSLSAEERAFFAAPSLRGPLTYGPTETQTAERAQARGQHIDMRA